MKCRICGSTDTPLIIDLGAMPLANSFLDCPGAKEELFPLSLCFCPNCSLVQLTESIPPEKLFRNYFYFSSVSQTMLDHAKELAESLIKERLLNSNSLVMEIASNDAYFLKNFVGQGIPVLGIDPAKNVAEVARMKGVPTLTEFFGQEMAKNLPKADAVVALNVLGHVPDLPGFVNGIREVLKPDGVCVIEVPYVRDMVDSLAVDTIYFEHLSYFSLTALVNLFKWNGLQVVKAERTPIHCGSLRIYVTHPNPFPPADRYGLEQIILSERNLGIDKIGYYRTFAGDVENMKKNTLNFLNGLKEKGQSIIGYGAAAKGTMMLNLLGVDNKTIDFVIDETPAKQGKFIPGVHIRVAPPSEIADQDNIIIFAWNWKKEIMSKHKFKGNWFTLLPRIKNESL